MRLFHVFFLKVAMFEINSIISIYINISLTKLTQDIQASFPPPSG